MSSVNQIIQEYFSFLTPTIIGVILVLGLGLVAAIYMLVGNRRKKVKP